MNAPPSHHPRLRGRLTSRSARLVLAAALAAGFTPGSARAQDAGALRVAPTLPDTGSLVRVEPLAVLGGRPRAEGAVQASTEDEELARWNLGGSSDPRHPSNRAGFHVAPRIMVDTTVRGGHLPARSSTKGVLSQLAVLAQSRNRGYWPFRVCYEAGLRREPALRGKVELRFSIARSGHVTASRVLNEKDAFKTRPGKGFREPEVARCIATRARALTFSPAPARRVDVDMTVELNPGDAPLPGVMAAELDGTASPGPPAPRIAPARLREAHAALAARTEALAACYTSGRIRDAGLWGRIGLRITLDTRGVRVVQHESRFPDASVVACVASVVQSTPCFPESPPLDRSGTLATGPVELEWAVRLGSPPAPPTLPAIPTIMDKSVVAETASARLPLSGALSEPGEN